MKTLYRMFQLLHFDRGNKFSHVEGWSLLKEVRIKTLFSVAVTEVMSIWFRCNRTGLTVKKSQVFAFNGHFKVVLEPGSALGRTALRDCYGERILTQFPT